MTFTALEGLFLSFIFSVIFISLIIIAYWIGDLTKQIEELKVKKRMITKKSQKRKSELNNKIWDIVTDIKEETISIEDGVTRLEELKVKKEK